MADKTTRGYNLVAVPGGSARFVLSRDPGGVGATGDRIQRLLVNVTNGNGASITLVDSYMEFPIMLPNANMATGFSVIELGVTSRFGPWTMRTGGGVSATAVGVFAP